MALHDAPTCNLDGVCKMDMRVDKGKTRLLYLPGWAGGLLVFSEITSRCLPVQTHLCHVDADGMTARWLQCENVVIIERLHGDCRVIAGCLQGVCRVF